MFFSFRKMSLPPNLLDWFRPTLDWFTKTERSSGFKALLIFTILTFVFALVLFFYFPGDVLLRIFGVVVVALPVTAFVITYVIKAFTQSDFCRSERHIERVRRMELETMGTDKMPLEAKEITSEPAIPKKQLKQAPPKLL
jgi:hypothetical protein